LTEEVQETEITGAMSNYVDTLSRSLKK